jgi:cytochrome P450
MTVISLLAQLHYSPWLFFGAALVLYAVYTYRQYARLSSFHGPFSTGWSHFWQVTNMLGWRRQVAYRDVNQKYGPIARISPTELLTSSHEVIAHMSAARSPYTRTRWFYGGTRVDPSRDHCMSELDEERHNRRRQQMAAGYSGKDNVRLEPDIDDCVQDLLSLLRSKYLSTNSKAVALDLGTKVQYFTLDVITKIGFGEAFGDLKTDSDVQEYLKYTEQGFAIVSAVVALGLAPVLQWPPIARLFGPSEKDASGLGKCMAVVRAIIDKRFEKPIDGYSDMLASFTHHGLTRNDLFVEAFLQMAAGADTSATAIRVTMLYVLSNPRVYRKLQAEIDATAATLAPGTPPDTLLKTLPYLQSVVREAIRMHPPAALEAPKVVPQGGDTVVVEGKEYYLPGGTNVCINAWGVHRNASVFGADADEFRPERWLPSSSSPEEEARLATMRRVSEMHFGWGKYQCLGKTIAWMEITKVVFEFFRHFDWALSTPEQPWQSRNYNGVFRQDKFLAQVVARR